MPQQTAQVAGKRKHRRGFRNSMVIDHSSQFWHQQANSLNGNTLKYPWVLGPGEHPIESVYREAQGPRGLNIELALSNTTFSSYPAALQHATREFSAAVTRAVHAKSAIGAARPDSVVVPEGALMLVLENLHPRHKMALSMLAKELYGSV